MNDFHEIFTLSIIGTLICGMIGTWTALAKFQYSIHLNILLTIIGGVCGSGIADYLQILDRFWVSATCSIFFGLMIPPTVSVIETSSHNILTHILKYVFKIDIGEIIQPQKKTTRRKKDDEAK